MNWDWMTLENIQHITKDNQFLIGGIGTVAFSGLIYRFKALPNQIYNALHNWYTINLELNTIIYSSSDLYRILNYLEGFTYRRMTKNFSLKDRRLIPGYGQSWACVNGLWIRYRREEMNKGYQYGDALHMTFFTRSRARVEAFIAAALPPEEYKPQLVIVNQGQRIERPLRPWSSVFAPEATKQKLRDSFMWFAQNEDWYIEHGLPYKFIVLIEGEPGVGKSSLITAFASEYFLKLEYVTNLYMSGSNRRGSNNDEPFSETAEPKSLSRGSEKVRTLAHLSFDRVVVLEDVDALGELNRQSKDYKANEDGQTVHELLNLTDSPTTPWGLIVIMTTNHPDRLDPALLRPGRIDCKLQLRKLEAADAETMFVSFYGEDYRASWQSFARQYYHPLAGADLQQAFYHRHAADALGALKTILDGKTLRSVA